MHPASHQFIEHIKSLKEERKELCKLLKSDPNRAYVYYLAPYLNVLDIYHSGGIKPRNLVKPQVDLSDAGVQHRRDKPMMFRYRDQKIETTIHDCVNFMLNPINYTYFNFRRNALLRRTEDPLSQLVCILEIDLEKLLSLDDVLWCVSERNNARTGAVKTNSLKMYSIFQWKRIYGISPVRWEENRYVNEYRSAEWVVYMNRPGHQNLVPRECIQRVMANKSDVSRLPPQKRDFRDFPVETIEEANISVLGDPIHDDAKWAFDLLYLSCGQKVSIAKPLNRIKNIENEIGIKLLESFSVAEMAYSGWHGAGHVLRVMFWILVLSQIPSMSYPAFESEETKAALYAAFIHDSCRSNHSVETDHGAAAAGRYQKVIREKLPLSVSERCLQAVTAHSRKRSSDLLDPITTLLMDADAIDRGRFGPPGIGGCDRYLLGNSPLKNNSKDGEKLITTGYHLAQVTRFLKVTDHVCAEFVETIHTSLKLVSKKEGAGSLINEIASEISRDIEEFVL